MATDFETWVERARSVPIESEIMRRGVVLRKSGVERVGPCPRCGGDDRFSINVKEGVWNCRGCKPTEISGDVIGLVQFLDDCNFTRACETLTQEAPPGRAANGRGNGHGHGHGHTKDAPKEPKPKAKLGPIAATFDYTDEAGKLLFQVTKHDPKDFRQRRPDGNGGWIDSTTGVRMVPYHLPELIEAVGNEQTVFIVEGEKDVDNVMKLGARATCNPRGAGKWGSCHIDEHFSGAHVVVIADNDPQTVNKKTGEAMVHADGRPRFAGWDHANEVCEHLIHVAADVSIVDLKQVWPGCPDKGDISDWIAAGGSIEALNQIAEKAPAWTPECREKPSAVPSEIAVINAFPIDNKALPRRPWLIPGLLMRRQVTLLVAPPGSGKSLLTLQLALVCSTGMAWSGWRPRGRFRTLVVNVEEDEDEMKRRLFGARNQMNIIQDPDGVFIAKTNSIVVAKADSRTKTVTATPMMESIVRTILINQIDVVVVDPFAETFAGDENSNSELKWCGVLWREVARRTNCAVVLVHHAKKYSSQMAGDMDAARGGGSLAGVARVVATLFGMTEQEAERMRVGDEDRGLYIRFDDAKSNLSLKAAGARWFKKETVSVGNEGTNGEPADDVGVLMPWAPPNPFKDMDDKKANEVLDVLKAGILDEEGKPTGDPFCLTKKGRGGSKRWGGTVIMEELGCDEKGAKDVLDRWMKAGVLKEVKRKLKSSKGVPTGCLEVDDFARPGTVTDKVHLSDVVRDQ